MQGVMEVERAGASCELAPGPKTGPVKNRRPIVSPKVQPPKPKRLTDEQSYLAAEYWDWAMKIAQKFIRKHKHYSFELDFESAAAVGLCESAMAFDPEHGVKFTTYAYIRVHGAITDMMRAEELRGYSRGRHGEAPQVQSLNRRLGGLRGGRLFGVSVQGREVTLLDFLTGDDLPTGWELRSIEEVESITRRLEWTYREVMILLYAYGFSQAKVARVINVSFSRVSQIHTAAIEFLRTAINPEALAS